MKMGSLSTLSNVQRARNLGATNVFREDVDVSAHSVETADLIPTGRE